MLTLAHLHAQEQVLGNSINAHLAQHSLQRDQQQYNKHYLPQDPLIQLSMYMLISSVIELEFINILQEDIWVVTPLK